MDGATKAVEATSLPDILLVAIAYASNLSGNNITNGKYGYREADVTECRVSWCAKVFKPTSSGEYAIRLSRSPR